MRWLWLCLLVSVGAVAQDAGTLPPTPGKAVVVMGTSLEALEKWAGSKPAERSKIKGVVEGLKVNERVALAVLIDGYELPRSRAVDVVADVTITDPEGLQVLERASASKATLFDPKTMTALLLKPVIPISFPVTAREGTYTVRATVWDQVRGTSLRVESHFSLGR